MVKHPRSLPAVRHDAVVLEDPQVAGERGLIHPAPPGEAAHALLLHREQVPDQGQPQGMGQIAEELGQLLATRRSACIPWPYVHIHMQPALEKGAPSRLHPHHGAAKKPAP